MRKRSSFLVLAVMALVLAGCGGEKIQSINQASDLAGKVVGAVSTAAPTKTMESLLTRYIGGIPKEVKFFNRASDLIAAVIAGKIDGAPCTTFVAEYYIKRNSKLKMIEFNQQMEVDVVMFLRSEDSLFRNDLDSAITILRDNGSLKQLEDTWITNLPVTNEPSNMEMTKLEGARTVYVGVSGDYTPLDYMAADGRPAGFNVAFLSEIGKLLKINFELVSIESQAKYSALLSKKIDLIFSQTYNKDVSSLFVNKFARTQSYFTDKGWCFLVKK